MTTKQTEWLRISLVLPFVLVCHWFGWSAWRGFSCSVFVGLAHALGMPAVRFAQDSFFCAGQQYRFETACTALDVFAGSIPLLWMTHRTVWKNVAFFAAWFVALFGLNQVRLAAGLWLFLRGVPWSISHEAFAGVFYFGIFLWIAHRRGWNFEGERRPVLAAS